MVIANQSTERHYLADCHIRDLMCSQCEPGYAPALYSYRSACVECKNYKYNWIKYIAIAYIPMTVLIVLLKVSVNFSTLAVRCM